MSPELEQAAELMKGFDRPWFIGGGWALDLAVGRQTRPHEDVEILTACFEAPERSVNGWEPAHQAQRRFASAMDELMAQAGRGHPIAVISHGLVLSLFLAHLEGKSVPALAEWRAIPMPGWAVVDVHRRLVVQPFTRVAEPGGQAHEEQTR